MQESQTVHIGADIYALAAFIGYLIFVIAIGIYAARFSSAGIREFLWAAAKCTGL
ncbi:MAG: hypothetical protein Q9P14_15855 [candidate division KSB1 bacterium]|nr:hypothetical protein [candidate division KSB1 bacterium]